MASIALPYETRRYLRHVNWYLIAAAFALTAFGFLAIQSADLHSPGAESEYKKQILYSIIGVGVMYVFSRIDYRNYQQWAPWLYGANLLLLAYVLKGGHHALGAQRWIPLGPLGTFQPSEPAKLILAIFIAWGLCKWPFYRIEDLARPLVAIGVPALLIVKQPDLGTTLVLLSILSTQLFFGLEKIQYFVLYASGVIATAAFTVGTNFILKPFQKARLLVFLNPKADPQGAGYNLNQSKIAVGSGEWFGRGLHHGTQTQLNFVPEHSRDFIFTVVAEELGLIGALTLVALYVGLLYGGIQAMLAARDKFGFLLAAGIVGMFAFHIVVNIGMTIGIMPITGIPLPFMSYGGSAILTNFAAIGMLLNIYAQKDGGMLGNA
ncbi:MAG TPA: rod shape-determining protein RodA [Candidatus Baltobacteraceae bacterium]|nr:rod shape-determining protein RodA [Candidatus Baltobacteraceae bacterium]